MQHLYNYMRHWHLELWLQNGIFFGATTKFDDPCEGHQSERPVHALADAIEAVSVDLGADSRAMEDAKDKFVKITRDFALAAKKQTFISCWHANSSFSPRMSATYGEGGVYIRTNPDRIILALRTASPKLSQLLKQAPGSGGDIFHQVRYIDDIDNPESSQALDDLLALSFHGNKRTVWEYQREWRLVIDAVEVTARTGIEINGTRALSRGGEDIAIDPKGLLVVREADGNATHLYVNADPAILIDEVGVTDEALLASTAALCERFGLPMPRLVTAAERMIIEKEEECASVKRQQEGQLRP